MKQTFFVALLLLTLAACSIPNEATAPEVLEGVAHTDQDRPQYVEGQVLVKFKEGVGASSVVTALGLESIQELSGGELLLQVPAQAAQAGSDPVPALVSSLQARPEVEYAQPNYLYYPQRVPNDTHYYLQWHYPRINLPTAWDLTTGSSSVRVAVLDTGSTPHPDLTWVGGYDFVSSIPNSADGTGRDSNPTDPGDATASFHGTHVGGTIAARSNNGIGVAGVCWGCQVVPIRVLGYDGGTTADIADAIRWASGLSVSGVPTNTFPVRVINLSLGGSLGSGTCSTNDLTSQNAINAAVARNVTVVVAAGNNSRDAKNYSPASCNNVITVAATETRNLLSSYSNWGSYVEVAAPGGDLTVDRNGDRYADGILSTLPFLNSSRSWVYGYVFYQGTSMAAPHVAGVVGLMLSRYPNLTPAQVLSRLVNTASALPCTGSGVGGCGRGLINARLAIQ